MSHHREQDPEQRGAEDLVRCGSLRGKHKNRQVVRIERTDHCTLRMTKEDQQTKNKNDLLFLNQSTGKPLSSRIWRDSLLEMLVEAGLATWSADDSNNQRKAEIKSGKILTWYSFRHIWITFALERGVPISTVCNNCDTSIEYIQQHYFHYDAKRATGALATGRKGLRAARDDD